MWGPNQVSDKGRKKSPGNAQSDTPKTALVTRSQGMLRPSFRVALEPRVMFDAAAMVTAAEVISDPVPEAAPPLQPAEASTTEPASGANDPEQTASPESATPGTTEPAETPECSAPVINDQSDLSEGADEINPDGEPAQPNSEITSIVFIDTDVQDPDTLVAEITENLEAAFEESSLEASSTDKAESHPSETIDSTDGGAQDTDPGSENPRQQIVGNTLVVLLNAENDNLESVTQTISDYRDLESIHFVTHGDEDLVRIGETWLSSENVDEYSQSIEIWGESLAADADILFYGCDLAADRDGQAFLNAVSNLSGADVAASTDSTGNTEFGGNWSLEFTLGSVQTHSIVGLDAQFGWRGALNFYTVTNTNSSGAGSLNWAITNGNLVAGPHEISFAISETDANHFYYVDDGVSGEVDVTAIATTTELLDSNILDIDPDHASSWYRIDVGTGLPSIDFEVIFKGETQSQFTDRPVIELYGATSSGDGLTLTSNASGSEIRHVAINAFGSDGLVLHGDNIKVKSSHIGTDVSGLVSIGNGGDGIQINGDFNIIGGNTAGDRNIISGNDDDGIAFFNAFDTRVEGNYIGINVLGDAALANGNDGLDIFQGADNAILNNVISGNTDAGIELDRTDGTVVYGNLIGTDATGQNAVGNEVRGIAAAQSTNLQIGGSNAGEGNVISGNLASGILLDADGSDVEGNLIGTDIDGDTALGNGLHGILVSGDNNTIGGVSTNYGNVVSANDGVGILVMVDSEDNTVQFNNIGTDISGTASLGNTNTGIFVDRADSNDIVDNLVSGNSFDAIVISDSDLIDIGRNTIGLDASGTAALGNGGDGVQIWQSLDADVFDNVISGNGDDGIDIGNSSDFTIRGNVIGLNAAGNIAIANNGNGIQGTSISDGTIGGTTSADRNIVSGNGQTGLWLRGDDLTITGNHIGTDAAGTGAIGNGAHGIRLVGDHNVVGGATLAEANVIGDSVLDGIYLDGSDNTISGNYIGTDKSETVNLENRRGVAIIGNDIGDNMIGGANPGEGNVIANNRSDGIGIFGTNNSSNSILGNLIYDQNDTAIDLDLDFVSANDAGDADTGANDLQNFPVITVAETDGSGFVYVEATLNSTPLTDYRIEFFSTDTADSLGHGEAEQYLGFQIVSTDSAGNATFSFSDASSTVALGSFVTATATVQSGTTYGSTSEMAANRATTTYDHGPVITTAGGAPSVNHIYLENNTVSTNNTATDQTSGDVLTWSLVQNADYLLFNINPVTGELAFNSPPDFEAVMAQTGDNKYYVTVQVEDVAGNTDTQLHVFNILNANEAPDITSDGGGSTAAVTVNEGVTTATTIVATDPDPGDSIASYAIVGGTDQAAFSLDTSNNLVFNTVPDYENPGDADQDNIYVVEVQVTDTAGLVNSQTITVTVDDVQNAPDIVSDGGNPVTTLYIPEGTTAVTTVVANDGDLPADTLEFSLAGGADAALFEIDLFTGDLRFKSAPNHEVPVDADYNGVYEVRVQVEDSTNQTDFQVIYVVVTDVNENPGITSTSTYSVNEGNSNVGVMSASDPDLPGDNISYAISGTDAAVFDIDSATGELTFKVPPDYEAAVDVNGNNIYELVLTVSDGQGGFDVKTIYVNVNNVDDTPPVVVVVEEEPVVEETEIPDPTPPEDPESDDGTDPAPETTTAPTQQRELADNPADVEFQTVETEIAQFDISRDQAVEQINQVIETLQERLQEDGGLPALAGFERSPLSLALIDLRTEMLDVEYSRSLLNLDMQPAELSRALLTALDSVLGQLADPTTKIAHGQIFSNAAIGLTVSVSVGYVGWLLRFGYLIAGFLSVGTTLRTFDPLPVLASAKTKKNRRTENEDDDSGDRLIEDMFEQG